MTSPSGICQKCKRRKKETGSSKTDLTNFKRNTIYDHKGLKVCRICGLSFESLHMHLERTHKMKLKDYVKKFKIERQYNALKHKEPKETEQHKQERIEKSIIRAEQVRACSILKRWNAKIRGGDR